ncbi:MAG: Protein arginine N-methyltransferase 1 [Myxococcaceae bacterium]|nr:Protein arginine N-methyltransferase 1 [Myxococcaceae bacterium]
MYTVLEYGWMAADGVRIDAYSRAIAKAVKPGAVVVDLGCGTGLMSLLALRAGARVVHGIDLNPAVWLARDLAAENGFADRFRAHHKSSFDVEIDEPVDVIVADLRGTSPLFDQNLAVLEDARKRWLSPSGVLIPARDRLVVALVEMKTQRDFLEQGWTSIEQHGFKAAAARSATLNSVYTDSDAPLFANQVLSEAKSWTEIEYGMPFVSTRTKTLDLAVTRSGSAHALAVWFEATLLDDIGFTTAPGNRVVYKRTVLPLLEPVRVQVGDTAKVTLRTDTSGVEWAWDTQIAGGPRVRQATFLGMPSSPEALLRESITATPERSSRGELVSQILAEMDGKRTLHDLIDRVASDHPGQRRDSLVDEVKTCVRRYAR